jgi:hypothetical protein
LTIRIPGWNWRATLLNMASSKRPVRLKGLIAGCQAIHLRTRKRLILNIPQWGSPIRRRDQKVAWLTPHCRGLLVEQVMQDHPKRQVEAEIAIGGKTFLR